MSEELMLNPTAAPTQAYSNHHVKVGDSTTPFNYLLSPISHLLCYYLLPLNPY